VRGEIKGYVVDQEHSIDCDERCIALGWYEMGRLYDFLMLSR